MHHPHQPLSSLGACRTDPRDVPGLASRAILKHRLKRDTLTHRLWKTHSHTKTLRERFPNTHSGERQRETPTQERHTQTQTLGETHSQHQPTRGRDILRFQRRPEEVTLRQGKPSGSRPQCGPCSRLSMWISCSPWARVDGGGGGARGGGGKEERAGEMGGG